MIYFIYIIIHNILPIFVLITLGFALSRKFELDIFTLSKLNFYLFVPSFIFVNLYETPLDKSLWLIVIYFILSAVINGIIMQVIGMYRGFDIGLTNAAKNAVLFPNVGNIGLSLITLVFSTGLNNLNGETPYLLQAQTILIIMLVSNNILSYTLGFYHAGRASLTFEKSIKKILSLPSLYAIPMAFILKETSIDITDMFFWPSLNYMKSCLVATSLITLGIQLSRTKIQFNNTVVHMTVFLRLIMGPCIAFCLNFLFGFTGITAQALLIIGALPSAVNTALIAVEFKNHEGYATQTVVGSTLLSAVTLSFVIYISQMLYQV